MNLCISFGSSLAFNAMGLCELVHLVSSTMSLCIVSWSQSINSWQTKVSYIQSRAWGPVLFFGMSLCFRPVCPPGFLMSCILFRHEMMDPLIDHELHSILEYITSWLFVWIRVRSILVDEEDVVNLFSVD